MRNKISPLLFKLLFIFFCAFFASNVIADEINPEKECKDNPGVVDKCFTIHGRISIYNGTPSVRIWQVGSKHLFGVSPAENEIMPEEIKKYLSFGTHIYGDFFVCPFTKAKTGYMQDVCVESVSNIVVEQYIEGKEKPKVFKLKNNADKKREKTEKD